MSESQNYLRSTATPFLPKANPTEFSVHVQSQGLRSTPESVWTFGEKRPRGLASPSWKCFLPFAAVIALLLGSWWYLGSGHGSDNRHSPNNIPQTPIKTFTIINGPTLDLVMQMRYSINYSVDPCQNFYQFACGEWIGNESVKLKEQTDGNISTTTELFEMDRINVNRITKLIENVTLRPPFSNLSKDVEQKIKRFYNSCMTQKFSSLKALLWPYIPGILEDEEVNQVMSEFRPGPEFLPDYVQTSLDFQETYQNDAKYKSTICTHFARELIPEGIAKLFVTAHYIDDPARVKGIDELIEKIWNTFRNITPSAPWIADDESRLNISRTISGTRVISGYLRDILHSTHVEELFADVAISDNFLLNLQQLFTIRNTRKKYDRFFPEFNRLTSKATAFYVEFLDTIFIPAGIVQTPAFHHSFPDVIKFAKLGTTVAHEFAHSLHAYVMMGILAKSTLWDPPIRTGKNFVTSKTRESYVNRIWCVLHQYEGLYQFRNNIPTPPIRVNGGLTLKENIADIMAMQIAFESFIENVGDSFQPIPGLSEKFSKEQIFFIAAAQGRCQAYRDAETQVKLLREQVIKDPHSPNPVRVLGSLQNYDEFSKAFRCPLGSGYNPEKKCSFF